MYYYTSDLHFDHKNIIKYCNRPYANVDEMNKGLVANWNSRVKPEDTVYILGDLTLAGKERALEFLKQLKGNKILVIGNHDTFAYKDSFDSEAAHFCCQVERKAMCRVHDPFIDKSIVLCHYPLAVWKHKEQGVLHFYGHVHNSTPERFPYLQQIDGAYNVGADVQGWYPRTAQEIINSNQK